ncbi:3',5'-cyclic-nucleotide phosphodiesterase [Methanosarcina barkeri 3]|uniref:3',5'-cyclic-nucleotide phosphodiesterase n=1 Tax=Methanosarcina barkeri 3 TaxID=1434107 RepID=A0A0E3SPT4_METBA|nr:metallophosphoesterase [Methanosarcina barkeri]AKB83812.1 3',5'-cyclic-nucleotide phosphodiesterase [Methanosarcina barkeri 3]
MPEIADSMLENINRSSPDIIVITGDLTENGLAAKYNGAKKFIDRIECKNKIIVPGNHDSRNAGYLFFEDLFKTRSTSGHFGEVTIVGIDSSQPELDEGHIGSFYNSRMRQRGKILPNRNLTKDTSEGKITPG